MIFPIIPMGVNLFCPIIPMGDIFFPIIPMGSLNFFFRLFLWELYRYSCPIRLVPNITCKRKRLLGKLQPDSAKNLRLLGKFQPDSVRLLGKFQPDSQDFWESFSPIAFTFGKVSAR